MFTVILISVLALVFDTFFLWQSKYSEYPFAMGRQDETSVLQTCNIHGAYVSFTGYVNLPQTLRETNEFNFLALGEALKNQNVFDAHISIVARQERQNSALFMYQIVYFRRGNKKATLTSGF
jgi:hypothetical protein